jgi:hypothetical protein
MSTTATVVARALLRSAAGERAGVDVPISAGNMTRLTPSPDAVAAVAAYFEGAGFSVLDQSGITIGIAGSKELFERHFGIVLAQGADHAYTVRAARQSRRPIDPTLIPDDRLPAAIRQAISQIALDSSATLDEPEIDR